MASTRLRSRPLLLILAPQRRPHGVFERCLSWRLVQVDLLSVTVVTTLRGRQSHGRLRRTYNCSLCLGLW